MPPHLEVLPAPRAGGNACPTLPCTPLQEMRKGSGGCFRLPAGLASFANLHAHHGVRVECVQREFEFARRAPHMRRVALRSVRYEYLQCAEVLLAQLHANTQAR